MKRLFPTNLPSLEWVSFNADGFHNPVTGTIYRENVPADNGLPLGGIDTGCIDYETTGLWGYITAFNSLAPRRGPLNIPALGFTANGEAYLCASTGMQGVTAAGKVHYWGHYPIADVEFEYAGPIQVGARTWTPFIPGQLKESMLPVAVMEVRLRNDGKETVEGRVALNFPGPDRAELRWAKMVREEIKGDTFQGVFVRGDGGFGPTFDKWNATTAANCILGVINCDNVTIEPFLGWNATLWKQLGKNVPPLKEEHSHAGTAVSVGYSLNSGEETRVRFIIGWHAPYWYSNGVPSSGGNYYHHMYAKWWPTAKHAVDYVSSHHESLLKRIIAWQSELYNESSLPGFLQDSLVNSLHLITECAVWAQAEDKLAEWVNPELGLFSLNEAPRCCPQLSCTPCNFFGDLPLNYFFPEATRSTLLAYKKFQWPTGQIPFIFGGICALNGTYETNDPSGGYQWALDGCCLLDMTTKLWKTTGDRAVLDEFYDMCKKVTEFTMNQRPAYGDRQIISMPEGNATQDWYEFAPFFGLTSHIGGVRLAHLKLMEQLARAKGDVEYADVCAKRFEAGSKIMEDSLWRGTHYGLYDEPETGKRSDMIMAHQLDGEWIARFHGVGTVFDQQRSKITLDTVARMNADPKANPHGAVVFVHADGRRPSDEETGYWTGYGSGAPGNYMLAMTDLSFGNRKRALDLLEKTLHAQHHIQRGSWDMGILYRTDDGRKIYGNDYNQNLMLWSVLSFLANGNLATPCQKGGLVDRILEAGKK